MRKTTRDIMNIDDISLPEAIDLHAKIAKEIKGHDKLYYEKNAPIISDAEYDQLVQICISLEEKYAILKDKTITKKVSGEASTKFQKVPHKVPMLSLSNIFEKEEIDEFIERIQKYLKISYFPEILAELKLDGLSFSALYKNGKLEVASTRGDGLVGEDITENLLTIQNFPRTIQTEIEFLEVRGEVLMDKKDFEALNERQKLAGKQLFANPRNAAAGSLRQLDSAITRSRPLKYYVYAIGFSSGKFVDTQEELLVKLEKLGFAVNQNHVLCKSIKDIENYYDNNSRIRGELPYEIDGIVYKVNDLALHNRLGFAGRFPRYAAAHKFPAILCKTKLLAITIQVGRTGALTPVANLEPVNVGGVVVSRASLHNFEEVARKDIRIGDIVTLKRAGDVIPQVNEVVLEARDPKSAPFEIPPNCPSCHEPVYKNDEDAVIRCTNILKCPDQVLERLIHFVSKPCFNIEGLGKKQVEFLLLNNYISNALDILNLPYSARLKELENEEGWGITSVENIIENINKSLTTTLDRIIFSLGIRHVGALTAKELEKYFVNSANFIESMEKLADNDAEIKAGLENIDGFGSKIIESLLEFFSSEYNVLLIKDLVNKLTIREKVIIESALTGKILVFTGSLEKTSRQEAKNLAEKLGAKVSSSVSAKTDFLIIGDKPGSKLKEAEKYGVKILSENEWITISAEK